MTVFMLDTNICIYAMKGHEKVLERLLAHPPSHIVLSVVTESELRFGAAKSTAPAKTLAALEHFLAPIHVVEFGSSDAAVYASVRATLERSGKPIGPLDTFIAAHALSRGMTLVTNNASEFQRVPHLHLENWAVV